MVFSKLAYAKNTGDYKPLMDEASINFGISLQHLERLATDVHNLNFIYKKVYVECCKRLVKRDFRNFQKDSKIISSRLNRDFRKKFPDLDVQSYRDALRGHAPMTLVLKHLILLSIEVGSKCFNESFAVRTSMSNQFQAVGGLGPRDEVPDDTYTSMGISKYFVSKGVFTMRASHSIALAESQKIKILLNILLESKSD